MLITKSIAPQEVNLLTTINVKGVIGVVRFQEITLSANGKIHEDGNPIRNYLLFSG